MNLLPAACARLMRASLTYQMLLDVRRSEERQPAGIALRGLGVSGGRCTGRARVVRGPADFEKIALGDVLVARTTSPAYNVLLPLLGAVVTDRGGLLCHAAIVAREFGLPAVVGTGEATDRIPDGARVVVDGTAGTVEVIG